MKPVGGASDDPEVKKALEWAKNLNEKHEQMDLLESEYDSMLELLAELYDRIDMGREPGLDLAHYEVTTGTVMLGFIDYEAEELLYVGSKGLLASRTPEGVADAASYVGLEPAEFIDMLREPDGRAWLFSGEDPSEWAETRVEGVTQSDEEAVAEVAELANMWETPEVVDEDALPSAEGRFGVRGEDGKWRPA